MFESLLAYETGGTAVVPSLAESYESSADGLTWTFHLAPNAKWSDGKQLTAGDVAWTVNTIIKYQNGPTTRSYTLITYISAYS